MTPRLIVKAKHAAQAARLWVDMSDNEKTGVRFGLFPFDKMQAAERAGFDSKELCIALMDCARRDGGMRA